MVCSGHFRKPAIRGSNSRGFIIGAWGGRRLHWCCNSSRACSVIGRSAGMGSPWNILSPKFDSPSFCTSVASGSIVYGVPWACLKCLRLWLRRCCSIWGISCTVSQRVGSVRLGTITWVTPPFVGFRKFLTTQKHRWFSSACLSQGLVSDAVYCWYVLQLAEVYWGIHSIWFWPLCISFASCVVFFVGEC